MLSLLAGINEGEVDEVGEVLRSRILSLLAEINEGEVDEVGEV